MLTGRMLCLIDLLNHSLGSVVRQKYGDLFNCDKVRALVLQSPDCHTAFLEIPRAHQEDVCRDE